MAIKTIFLDRDGVINKELNYLYKIQDFEFIKGVFDACVFFQNLNYSIIIISNQSGIGRGLYSEKDYLKIKDLALQEKQLKEIEKWQESKIMETFISIANEQKTCDFKSDWLKKEN